MLIRFRPRKYWLQYTGLIVLLGLLWFSPGCSCVGIVPPASFTDRFEPNSGKGVESFGSKEATPPTEGPSETVVEDGSVGQEEEPVAEEPTVEEPVVEPEPKDRCVPSPCDPNATCEDQNGQAVCKCKPGFTGDGFKCEDIAATLDGLRWELACTSDWEEYDTVCFCPRSTEAKSNLKGPTTTLYSITLRFRGVIETKEYSGGSNDGKFWQVGGNPINDNWNVYRLTISNPPQTYYINRGKSGLYYCLNIDYSKTVQAYGGSTFTLYADSVEGRQIKNLDSNKKPIPVPGVKPDPATYNGQFVQMDVVKIEKAKP